MMLKKNNAIIFVLLLLITSSCTRNSDDISSLVKKWQGKEIKMPENLQFTVINKDGINYKYKNTAYKIFVYVDSIGCLSCKLHLEKWKEVITLFDSITNRNISYLFILDTKNVNNVKEVLEDRKFDYPVYIDIEGKLNSLNHFPQDDRLQTFLLNKENEVIVVGNPVNNTNIRNLYLIQMLGKENLE